MDRATAVTVTLAAAFIWGSSFPAIKMGLFFIDPLTFSQLRLLLAAVLLLPFLIKYRSPLSLLLCPSTWLLAAFNTAGFLLQNLGMNLTTASKASLLVNMHVVFVAVLSYLILKEEFTKLKVAAVALSILGVFLLTTRGNIESLLLGDVLGDLLVLGAGASWGFFFILVKRALCEQGCSPIDLNFAVIISTAVFLLPAPLLAQPMKLAVNIASITILFYTAVPCTILAFILWMKGLEVLPATTSAILLLVEILVAILLSVMFLGDTFTSIEALGGALLIAAIALTSFSS